MIGLAACDRRPDSGPVVVSVIGEQPRFDGRSSNDEGGRVLIGALAEGLVRFDAAGQIEPGLAERWIVIDGGLRYIFRLREAEWSDGRPVTTAQVVTILKRRLRDPANSLAPFVTAIDDVVEMTPQVLEVRLDRPRPDLLKLFAQPELGIVRGKPPGGGGPFRMTADATGPLLRAVIDPDVAGDDDGAATEPKPEANVRLIGERTARAVARFVNHDSDLVLGGTAADWPIVAVAQVAPANVRVDPAVGLFGLAIVRREGLLADNAGRAAVAAAIDRAAIADSLAPGTAVAETILPDALDSAAAPARPDWIDLPLADRRATASAQVAAFRSRTGAPPILAIALPAGPGGDLLYRRLRFALGSVGILASRVAWTARDADLRLIDQVAPYDSARWYLRTACVVCGPDAEAAIENARLAQSLRERATALAAADAALTADGAFIPLLRPLRWSLVSLRLAQFQGNPRAWHPLDHLRNDPEE